jgi:hypothetical protein
MIAQTSAAAAGVRCSATLGVGRVGQAEQTHPGLILNDEAEGIGIDEQIAAGAPPFSPAEAGSSHRHLRH